MLREATRGEEGDAGEEEESGVGAVALRWGMAGWLAGAGTYGALEADALAKRLASASHGELGIVCDGGSVDWGKVGLCCLNLRVWRSKSNPLYFHLIIGNSTDLGVKNIQIIGSLLIVLESRGLQIHSCRAFLGLIGAVPAITWHYSDLGFCK